MPDLVEFLRARLDERAKTAQAALDFEYEIPEDAPWWAAQKFVREGCASTWDSHVALNDPATVLADVEAKRRIIEQYERALENRQAHPDDLASAGALLVLHGAIESLTMPYADHPDYDPGWKP